MVASVDDCPATDGSAHGSAPARISIAPAAALERGRNRLHAGAGPISLYYASRTLLPAKTRAFVAFVVEAFKRDRLAKRFAGNLG
jgi:hypothetical protein